MISDILLGVAAGTFISAVVNHNYNTAKWIRTKYLVWIGVIILIASFILGWPDFRRELLGESEATSQVELIESN